MALITYEHKTDGVYCGGCSCQNQDNEFGEGCNIFDVDELESVCVEKRELFRKKYPVKWKTKRCDACIKKFGK